MSNNYKEAIVQGRWRYSPDNVFSTAAKRHDTRDIELATDKK